MNSRQTPYAQIARVLQMYFKPQDARWLYLTVACIVAITVASGGIATQWGVAALIKSVIGLIVVCLQFFAMYSFTALMRLNQVVASRLVPGYVPALRRTALTLWLAVCAISGLVGVLGQTSLGNFVLLVFASGAAMLLISAPLRWPVQWVLFMVGLVWFLRHSVELFESGPLHILVVNKMAAFAVVTLIFAGMGWLVTRLIAENGSSYASLFSRFLGMKDSERMVDKPNASAMTTLRPWLKAYALAARGATLPWRRYARYLLARRKPGPSNLVARAELGFGPVVHWVSQASFSLCFAALIVVVWWLDPDRLLEAGLRTSPKTAFFVALISVMCAATSVLYIGDVLMRTQGEQKLMLLLPGMPVGNPLSRLLAVRHLRQAFAAWGMATAWALFLPYPDSASIYVAAFCWGTLPLIPFIVQDWSTVRPPQAVRALLTLVLTLLGPVIAWVALRWLHVPVWLVGAVAVGVCLTVLRMRWGRLSSFAQAFPVGQRLKFSK